MTAVAAIAGRTERTDKSDDAARITRVNVFNRLKDVETTWRKMETAEYTFTPFQRFDFLSSWQTRVGELEGFTPFIVVGFSSSDRPLVLIPLGVRQENGARTASFLGGKHSTFNMPLFTKDFADNANRTDIETLLELLRATQNDADLLALTRQPLQCHGLTNPLSLLPRQISVNPCPLMALVPHLAPAERISNSFRRRLKGKERKLQALPGYRYVIARRDEEIRRILDAFFVIKPQRMAAQNLPNVFSEPGIRNFIFDACLAKLSDDARAIEIHALECDDEVIAIFAGVADGQRFSMMFNTYTTSANAKFSPGLILLRSIIDHYAELNYTSLDLGIGADEYKLLFCKDQEPIFDGFLPLTTRGSIAALGLSSLTHAKRFVKQTPALAQMAQLLRGALHR